MNIKFRYLPLMFDKENIGHFMNQCFGLNRHNKLIRFLRFRSTLRKAITAIVEMSQIDLSLVAETGWIELPNIEHVSFKARSEADMQLGYDTSTLDKKVSVMANLVAIMVYQQVYNRVYDDDEYFLKLKERILDTDYRFVFGAFNTLVRQINDSRQKWNDRFQDEQVESDPDYSLVHGERLNKFNILTIISRICSAYNIDYYQAWDLPYSVVQTTLWMNLTRDNVQNAMTTLKEARLKSKKQN